MMGGFQASEDVGLRLTIIGLDGADYNYIEDHSDDLPTLYELLVLHGGRLECDIDPPHSAACWSQIFAGTTFGLTDFPTDPKKRAEMANSDKWLWSDLEDISIVVGVPAMLPPISVNHEDGAGWIDTVLSITAEQMLHSTYRRSIELAMSFKSDIGLFITVWPATDRAGHIYGMDAAETLGVYKAVDGQLSANMASMEKGYWIILSDHGMSSSRTEWEPKDTRKGWHSIDGIIASNLPNIPHKLSEVYDWILEGPK